MKLIKKLFNRTFLFGLIILLQIIWVVIFSIKLEEFFWLTNTIFMIISIIVIFYIVSLPDNPSYKLAWVIPILIFPVIGCILYAMLGNRRMTKAMRRRLEENSSKFSKCLPSDEKLQNEIKTIDPVAGGLSYYIKHSAGFPIFQNTESEYFQSGEDAFVKMLAALSEAKKFIFMEYFILETGVMWDQMLAVLRKKRDEGVEIRIIYDDMGSSSLKPFPYEYHLRKEGFGCKSFNRFVPFVSAILNHRDHRKILVIDGIVGFTGGYNIADEYINQEERFGYWKDSGVMLRGEAVASLTNMFLTVWNGIGHTSPDKAEKYFPKFGETEETTFANDGYVQPYGDSPLDYEAVGENIYLNLINNATNYVYFTTPYLIVDNEMMTAICLAAKRGVDVRVYIPGIPDKKIVYWLTQSYLPQMMEAGVKIYRFDKGFLHEKTLVCDDVFATVGTINFDYRSLYLHFECGVLFYRSKLVRDTYDDLIQLQSRCTMLNNKLVRRSLPIRFVQVFLRMFAPLF